ncbi:MAG: lysylphosphatidylglycerol synthase domain-containing protein [Kosmotogaceae bacterium]
MIGIRKVLLSLRRLLPFLGIVLFSVSIYVLVRELSRYTVNDIVAKVGEVPASRLVIAVFLTFLTYLNLSLYDLIASRRAGVRLKFTSTALVSFVGYAFSKNIGFTFLSGTSVRFRLYGKWGVAGGKILAIIILNYLTFWLGFFALSGILFTLWPPVLQSAVTVPFGSLKAIGIASAGIYLLYVIVVSFRKRPLRIKGRNFTLPGKSFTLVQTGISILDWLLSAGVLFMLLPPEIGYLEVLGVFLLSQFAGLSSQVPGGLGVFEALTIVILSPTLQADTIVAALILFRIIFYLAPFLISLILFGINEFLFRSSRNSD